MQKTVFDLLYKITDLPFLGEHRSKVLVSRNLLTLHSLIAFSCYGSKQLILWFHAQDLLEKAETQPNLTIGIIISIIVVVLTILFKLLFGGKKAQPVSVVFHFCTSRFTYDIHQCDLLNLCLQAAAAVKESKKSDGAETSNGEGKEEKEDSGGAPRRRSTRRDN